jgi:hypothetical protein
LHFTIESSFPAVGGMTAEKGGHGRETRPRTLSFRLSRRCLSIRRPGGYWISTLGSQRDNCGKAMNKTMPATMMTKNGHMPFTTLTSGARAMPLMT